MCWEFSVVSILAHFKAKKLSCQNCSSFQKLEISFYEIAKMGIFELWHLNKIDFTENLSGRKILKFPYCVSHSVTVWKNEKFAAMQIFFRQINLE